MAEIQAISDPENSRNILFTYFSPNINDNLSSFAGPFIARKHKQQDTKECAVAMLLQQSV